MHIELFKRVPGHDAEHFSNAKIYPLFREGFFLESEAKGCCQSNANKLMLNNYLSIYGVEQVLSHESVDCCEAAIFYQSRADDAPLHSFQVKVKLPI